MPRRPPPSPLLLRKGPLPPRDAPKHVMPALPQPIFQPSVLPRVPAHRKTYSGGLDEVEDMELLLWACIGLKPLVDSGKQVLAAPWNHSGPLGRAVASDRILAPLKPAAILGGR